MVHDYEAFRRQMIRADWLAYSRKARRRRKIRRILTLGLWRDRGMFGR